MSLSNLRKFNRDRAKKAVPAPKLINGKIGVLLAVPTFDGYVRWSIAHQFGASGLFNSDPSCPFLFQTLVQVGTTPVEYSRNLIVDHFMDKTECTWLYMWDSDQEVPDNWPALLMLRDSARVLSATTFCWVGNQYAAGRLRLNQYSLDEKGQCFNIAPASKDRPYFVPVVGTGCIAIHREVFDKIGRNPFEMTRYPSQRVKAGEDINFSIKAQRAGFQILVHPGVIFDHVKEVPLKQIGETISAVIHAKENNLQPTQEQMLSIGA